MNLDEVLADLRSLFRGCSDNLFLRGSLARSEYTRDIDISAYNPKGSITKGLPNSFRGVPISYGTIPLEELDSYFNTCFRGTTSLLECVDLSSRDSSALQIIQTNRDVFYAERIPAFVLFLQAEEEIANRNWKQQETYHSLKRAPGSRRTINRTLWTLQLLHEEIRHEHNTNTLLEMCVQNNYLPTTWVEYATSLMSLLSAPACNSIPKESNTQWSDARHYLHSYFLNEIKPQSMCYAASHLNEKFSSDIQQALSPDTSKETLLRIAQGDSQERPYENWIKLFTISANPTTSEKALLYLVQECKTKSFYRHVLRNIIKNPGATPTVLAALPTELDMCTQAYLDARMMDAHARNQISY